MISFTTVLQAVLPVYFLVATGMALRRFKVLTPESDGGLMRLVIHFLYPSLILDKILGNDLVRKPEVVAWGVGAGFGIIVSGFAVAFLVSRLLGMKAGSGSRSFTLAGGIQNYGYTAIPVLVALFGSGASGDRVLGVLFVHSLGVEIALWVVGIMILSGSFLRSPKALLNGPIVAVVLGLVLVYTELWRFFEIREGSLLGSTTRQTMSWLGACAFPMALILIGATIHDLLGKEKLDWKVAGGAILVRNVLMAGGILGAAKFLPIIPELKQVLIVQAGMPAAVTPILLTRIYGGQPQVAVQVVISTSLVSLVTMPFIVAWGAGWVF